MATGRRGEKGDTGETGATGARGPAGLIVETRPNRGIPVLLAVLGIGLLLAGAGLATLLQRQDINRSAIERNRQAIGLSADEDARREQEMSELRRLVQALQDQVRNLGGTPLTTAPTPRKTAESSPSAEPGSPNATPRRKESPHSSKTMQPRASSSSPTPRPSASSSPSAICLVNTICLPPASFE